MTYRYKNIWTPHRSIARIAIAAILFCLSAMVADAQVNATLNGYVRDPNKAPVAGATVTVENPAIAVKRTVTTNDEGYFTIPNLQVGVYKVAAQAPGFATTLDENIKLDVGASVTMDIDLRVGGAEAVVNVTAEDDALGVNKDTGNVETLISEKQVTEHALNGRTWAQLVNLAPGTSSLLNDSQQGTNVRIDDTAINGLRRRTAPTIDGVSNVDHGSVGTQVNNISVDAIQEFKLVSSPYSAEFGGQAGPAINVATKRGTSDFHGSFFEFIRHDALNAFPWESKQTANPEKAYLRLNDFGGFVGGPIIKKKLFFFGGMEFKRPRTGRTINELVPTDTMRNGDFSAFLPSGLPANYTCATAIPDPNGINRGKFILCDKSASTTGTPFANNIIPLNKQSPNGRALLNLFPRANAVGSSGLMDTYIDAPITVRNVRQDLLRVDYEVNPKASIFWRWLNDDFDSDNPLGSSFDNQNLPIAPDNHVRKGKTFMTSYTQMIGSTWVNEAILGWQRNDQAINYIDESVIDRTARGITFQEIFPENRLNKIPQVAIQGYSTISGNGLPYSIDARSWEVRDNLTKVWGNHTLKFGGLFINSYKAENTRVRDGGTITFTTTTGTNVFRPQDSNNAVGNALLGAFSSYTEVSNTTNVPTAYNQWELYANDQWRATRRLSLNFGLRLQYIPWPYTDLNNFIGFDPSRFDPAKAPASTNISGGVINLLPDPTGTRTRAQGYYDPFNGIVLPGSSSPFVTDPNLQRLFSGRPSGLADSGAAKFAPRFGFALDIFGDGKTSLRGGGGIYYDRTLLNPVRDAGANPPFAQVPIVSNGRQFTTPNNLPGTTNFTNTLDTIGAAGAGRPLVQALAVFNFDMPPGEVYSYSLGVQRLLPYQVVVDVSYVGNQARHLTHRRDINYVLPEVALATNANGTFINAAQDTVRQFLGYSAINMQENTGYSSYNSLQISAMKRMASGFSGGFAYTFSKALSNFDTETSNLRVPFDASLDNSVSLFDRPHVFVGNFIYDLPFGKNQQGFAGKLLGGWQVAGIITLQSGLPANISGGTRASTSPSNGYNGNLDLVGDWRAVDGGQTPSQWINRAAFTGRTGLIGTVPRNLVRLPSYQLVNMSLTKRTNITEKVRLQLRGEVFNLFNRPNFRTLVTNFSASNFGALTETDEPRVFQLGAKILF